LPTCTATGDPEGSGVDDENVFRADDSVIFSTPVWTVSG
jgi:hypothetical protein